MEAITLGAQKILKIDWINIAKALLLLLNIDYLLFQLQKLFLKINTKHIFLKSI